MVDFTLNPNNKPEEGSKRETKVVTNSLRIPRLISTASADLRMEVQTEIPPAITSPDTFEA
jgi:hypothetical protein